VTRSRKESCRRSLTCLGTRSLRPCYTTAVRHFLLAFSALLGLGCPSAGSSEPPTPAPYVQPAPWEELDADERKVFMERLFNPVMDGHFRDFDPETYAAFGCATCHGEDGEEQGWEMPSDAVESISLADTPVEDIEDPERREVGIWMDEVILPEMGRLFEQELTIEGASCLDCHPFDATLPGR